MSSSFYNLELILLGGFDVHLHGCPVDGFFYNKMRALLAYLAVEREQDHGREVLAELLWSGNASATARGNLRRTLADLRRVLELPSGRALFSAGKHTIRFLPNLYVDATDFSEQPLTMPENPGATFEKARIAALYRGEFLAGLSLPDCPDFEDWLRVQREALHCRAIALLEQLATGYGQMGDYGNALQYALRHTELDAWDEDAHGRAMRFYALSGQTGAALRQYEICCHQLKNALGVLPSAETRHLAERIRGGEFSQARADIQTAPPPTERRQVTVLYCGLTPEALEDPEEELERLFVPQARCVDIIRRFTGHVVQAHGGALLAYFGFPEARENAAILAVQAALAVAREARDGVEIRAGVHTGMIVADAYAAMPDTAGRASKLAIRLCCYAGCGEVAVSRETHAMVAGYFDCLSLGLQALPEFAQSLEVFKVTRESGARSRLDGAAQLTPWVGRKAEIAALMRCWDEAEQGVRTVVAIQGEAGIGKSRLLLTLKQRLAGRPHAVRELRCFPEFSQSPFQPLIALVAEVLGFDPDAAPEAKSLKLASYIEAHYPDAAPQAVPLLARLLSLPLAGHYQVPALSPKKQKELTCSLLLAMLQSLARQQPVLLIVEDLHWIDPSTLELLTLFVEQPQSGPVLVLLTARPEFEPPWKTHPVPVLALAPLSGADVMEMIAALNSDIPADTARRILNRADGVPLFVEELTRIAGSNHQADIPATLHDLLVTRMDGMGGAKYTAQLAAAIGREFDLHLLSKVSSLNALSLRHALGRLQHAGLVLDAGGGVYQFKHALIQEAAYHSQTKAHRLAAHRRIALALLADFPVIAETRSEVIAQHLNSAGEFAQAIACWLKAAQRTPLYSCNVETVTYLEAGLAALDNLPAGADKDRLEFALQVRLGPALQATQGYGSDAALQAFYRATALSEKIGNTPGLFQAQLGLCIGISSHPGFGNAESLGLCRQLLSMAQAGGNPLMLQQAHHVLGNTLFWMGCFEESHLQQLQAIALDPAHDRDIAADDSGRITSVTCQAFLSWLLWFQGFPEQAQVVSALSVQRARQFDHPNTLAFVLTFAAALQRWSGNLAASLAYADEGIVLARKMDLPIWLISNTMQQGWVLAMQGEAAGVAQIRQCVESMRNAMGGVITSFSAPLAEALLHHGQAAEALSVLNDAIAEGEKKQDRHFEAELHRLKGECLMALARRDAAAACFELALSISRRQQAKALELRAAESMARLRRKQGKPE
ncbi:MAG: hypothetical protein EPN21_19795 [Methylococcaceae bacterium]|nr:MAG: hypothetical protein EPN21_19795 [Methylococcaceae bacterium]